MSAVRAAHGRIARAPLLALALGLALALAPPARAQLTDVFTVHGVEVDVTASAAAAAREKALAQGQRAAFERLLRRLTLRQDWPYLPTPGGGEIVQYVQALEVDEEKASSVRYIAEFTVHFKRNEVRRLLRRAGVPYAETVSKPVVVLPIYVAAQGPRLWEEPNPWREAWLEVPSSGGLVPFIVPVGDVVDMRDVNVEQALRGEPGALDAIARRYGADDVLVVTAAAGPAEDAGPDTPPTVSISLSRLGEFEGRTLVLSLSAGPEETLEELLRRAAGEVAVQVEEDWKRENLLRFDKEETLVVSVPLSALEDWIEVRRRLDGVPFVRETALRSLSREEARLAVRYIGEVDQLALALAQRDLDLSEDATSWVLSLKGSGPQSAFR